MKKILLLMFVALSIFAFGSLQEEKVLSQQELLEKMDFSKAQTYEKYKEVYARKAVPGEIIKTYTKDGLETQNIAKEGDFVVRNITEAEEMYILTAEKFNSRYEFKADTDNEWKLYKPLGKIKGIKVDNKILRKLADKFEITPEGDLLAITDCSVEKNDFTFDSNHKRDNKEFLIHHLLFDFTK